ncbi:hypothetical protein Acid345_4604 [Candidatus Koribacter versatilis Ellin345]|uniref:DUF3828 domain-containing protein n=1 Tax=Koribacter versatilis (strain Ellin345) TaxID=204669 RepID=Q1IHP6_KORVE|nr:hypothetical protein [Candidatus Koribacter versatilis]ABF43604.1 hypothetical protein Acid345_4604 [Candidatus Koribacter versatilis Ellin345]
MRRVFLILSIAAIVIGAAFTAHHVLAATPSIQVQLAVDNTQPRQVEEATQAAVLRDYKEAWKNLATAMENNRADALSPSFVGFAQDKLNQAIDQQKKNGLRRKYVDHGHKVEAVFYSYDGSALQLKDSASVEVQLLDGNKVVATEPGTIHYMVLMTPAENSWKIRDLEAVPSF